MADKISHVRDDLLGFVPRAGYCEPSRNIDANSLRCTGKAPSASSSAPILAVGDSFTFGEEVSDLETWPAQLQQLIGRRVLNGGVSGYGLDQIVLRAEQLTALHKPAVVVASFIADDIRRTEMRRVWGYDKPWFAIEGDRLVLKGVPMPARAVRPLLDRPLAERLLCAFTPSYVQHWVGYHARAHPRGTGLAIARRLTERLAALQAKSGAKVIVLAQYDPRVWDDRAFANTQRGLAQVVLDGATDHGLAVLDSFAALAAVSQPRQLYRILHMNARGNLLIARLVADALSAGSPAAAGRR